MVKPVKRNENLDTLRNAAKVVLTEVGEDAEREGLIKTPDRYAKAMRYLTGGYELDPVKVLNNAVFEEGYDEMVVVKDIEIFSMCEHHLLPFIGKAHVAYIPNGRIVGLSKIARVVDIFARRLQVQERLTKQIADTIFELLRPKGVGVVVEAKHLCMMMRGVEKQNSECVTSAMLGDFLSDGNTRKEFLNLVR